ncbi:MAG: tetratricopeptide repeat protein, partial [Alphaproteobacteria bacterium]
RVAADSAVSTRLFEPDQLVFAHDLLDVPQSAEQRALYDAMDNDVRNRGKQKLVATLIKRISRNRPLFILVEDIHSAGRLTLDHLARMTATVGQCPAILVMTSRTEGDPLDRTWRLATGQTAMMTIDVAPLREEEALVLADGFMDATHQFARNCVERAEGNPLFLEQLLRSALAKEDEEVPGSVQSIVLARVDRLSPRDKRALQVAAVLGQRFSIETARYLLDEGDYDCAALIDQNLVRATDEDYLFAHALIWESVYQSLVTDRKRELHMRAAKWFSDRDPMLRAEHLDRAGDATAARAYLEAAQVQTKLYHFERALRLLERGAEIARNPADRFDLLATQGMCLRDIGRPAESISVYRQALKVAETNVARSHALIGLAAGMRVTDEFDEALSALDEAEALTRDDPKLLRERSEVHYYRGNLYFPLGRLSGCLEEHKLALDLALEAHCPECEARALSGLGDAYYSQGRMKKALDYFKRCVDLSRHNGFGRIEVSNQYMIAWNRLYMAEVPGSVEDAREAIEAAERVAHRRALMVAELAAGRTLIEYGSPAEAARHIDRGLALVENLGASRFKPFFLIFLARVRLAEGGYRPETVALMEEALDVSHRTGFGFLGPWVLSTLALVSDDRARQTKALEEGEEALAGDCVGHNYYAFYQDAMEIAARNSDWNEVDRYADALDDYARTEPLPLSDFLVARGRALARHGRGDAESLSELQRLEDDARSAGLIRMARDLERVLAERA